jgi:hypothetical protein
MMVWRFAFAIVLAMHAWSSESLAEECRNPLILMDAGGIARNVAVSTDENGFCVLGATKGDIDALNKRLDKIEDLIRCEAASAKTRAGGYSGAIVACH